MIQDKERKREVIVKRVAQELKDGNLVNLGIGMPTLVANYIPEGVDILLQSENGYVGIGPGPEAGKEEVSAATEADLIFAEDLKVMNV